VVLNALVFHSVLIPLFATRIFATMFWVSVWAYCQQHGYFDFFFNISGLEFRLFLEYPEWLTKWPTVLGLGLLSLAEWRLENSTTWIKLIESFDGPLKGLFHIFFSQWVFVKATVATTTALFVGASFGLGTLWAIPPAIAIWILATFRRRGLSLLTDMDEGDDLGLRKLLTQVEEIGIASTAFFLIVLPIIALALSLTAIGILVLIRVYVAYREQQIQVPCSECHADNHPSALECKQCRTPFDEPVGISLFNQPTDRLVTDLVQHRLHLLCRKRCPNCATQLPKLTIRQSCPGCQTDIFSSIEQAQQLDHYLYWKFPKVLLVVALLGFIPLLGLIPGIMYYRLNLIAGYRGYLPRTSGCFVRVLERFSFFILVITQGIPVLGAISLPLLCFLHTAIYRTSFRRETAKAFGDNRITQGSV